MSLHFAVLYGSVRSDRRASGRAVHLDQLAGAARGDPGRSLEVRLPLLDRMYKEYPRARHRPSWSGWRRSTARSTASSIVSGEYNHGIPPALKNLLDHFLEEYFFRPSAIVCYSAGSFGGVRAAMQLRMTLAELGTVTHPVAVPGAQGTGRVRRGGQGAGPGQRAARRAVPRRAGMVRAGAAGGAGGGHALLSIRPLAACLGGLAAAAR